MKSPRGHFIVFGFIEKNQLRDIPISDFWSDKFLVAKNTNTHKKELSANEEMNDLAFLGSHLNGIFVKEFRT